MRPWMFRFIERSKKDIWRDSNVERADLLGRLSQSLWTTKTKNFYHPNQLSTRCLVESFNSWLTVPLGVVVHKRWLNLPSDKDCCVLKYLMPNKVFDTLFSRWIICTSYFIALKVKWLAINKFANILHKFVLLSQIHLSMLLIVPFSYKQLFL